MPKVKKRANCVICMYGQTDWLALIKENLVYKNHKFYFFRKLVQNGRNVGQSGDKGWCLNHQWYYQELKDK